MKNNTSDLPIVAFATPRAFATWLAQNHADSRGLWIKFARKTADILSVTYGDPRGPFAYGLAKGESA